MLEIPASVADSVESLVLEVDSAVIKDLEATRDSEVIRVSAVIRNLAVIQYSEEIPDSAVIKVEKFRQVHRPALGEPKRVSMLVPDQMAAMPMPTSS